MHRLRLFVALLVMASVAPAIHAQGPILSGAGPINRSMGGASTAAPLDATGTMYWNPAGLGGLRANQLDLNFELLYPRSTLSSSIPGGALGPGFPPAAVGGTTRDEAGAFALPSGGLVYRGPDSSCTWGLGVFPAAGFGVNYPAAATNPLLTPPPPNGFGLGHIASQYQVVQIAPSVACQITDKLSVGFSPLLDLARLTLDPGVFAAANDANGDGSPNYPSATGTRTAWGGGFQVGAYYTASDAWQFGAAFKSRQWSEAFRFNAADELGRPQAVRFRYELPLTVSVGAAFTGIDRLLLAADVRYFDFGGTSGSSGSGFAPTGAVTGLGWNDVFAVAAGAQWAATDSLTVRGGYTYNTSLIPPRSALANAASPLAYQHQLAVGVSYRLTPTCDLSATYYHIFADTVTGPYASPAGAIPGATVTTGTRADSLLFGASVRF